MCWGRELVLARHSSFALVLLGHLLLQLLLNQAKTKAARVVVAESCAHLKHAIKSDHGELGDGGGLLIVELLSLPDKPMRCDESIFISRRQEVLIKDVSDNSADDRRQQ